MSGVYITAKLWLSAAFLIQSQEKTDILKGHRRTLAQWVRGKCQFATFGQRHEFCHVRTDGEVLKAVRTFVNETKRQILAAKEQCGTT